MLTRALAPATSLLELSLASWLENTISFFVVVFYGEMIIRQGQPSLRLWLNLAIIQAEIGKSDAGEVRKHIVGTLHSIFVEVENFLTHESFTSLPGGFKIMINGIYFYNKVTHCTTSYLRYGEWLCLNLVDFIWLCWTMKDFVKHYPIWPPWWDNTPFTAY